jgi:uncharacterized protein (DUF4415 family)
MSNPLFPVERMTDTELEKALARASDRPAVTPYLKQTNDWNKLRIVWPDTKIPVSLRLDEEILQWFRRQGPGYQTRINAVLRAFVQAQPPLP